MHHWRIQRAVAATTNPLAPMGKGALGDRGRPRYAAARIYHHPASPMTSANKLSMTELFISKDSLDCAVKRVAKRTVNMQWFKIPEKIYFEYGSLKYLQDMPEVERVFIVTDESMVKLGYVDKIMYQLSRRHNHVQTDMFY